MDQPAAVCTFLDVLFSALITIVIAAVPLVLAWLRVLQYRLQVNTDITRTVKENTDVMLNGRQQQMDDLRQAIVAMEAVIVALQQQQQQQQQQQKAP